MPLPAEIRRLPAPALALYEDLLAGVTSSTLEMLGVPTSGSFVRKVIRGHAYLYYQYREGGRQRHRYIGPATADLQKVVERIRQVRGTRRDLGAAGLAAGLAEMDPAGGRIIRAAAAAGVFASGGVLVGTYAFAALQNVLGVRWPEALRTGDVDLCREVRVQVAVDPARTVDLRGTLERLDPAAQAVFQASRPFDPPTSFDLAGLAHRVDVLAPMRGPRREKPVLLASWGVHAAPLRFLDYLIESPLPGVVLAGGDAIYVLLPSPARYFLHKMIVASRRPPSPKTAKDLRQAALLGAVLAEDRPADVSAALRALVRRGPGWVRPLRASAARMPEPVRTVVERTLRRFRDRGGAS